MSKNRARIGIALLSYNQGRYIPDAIKSLKKQSFQDFEVYLIDDGSDDDYTQNIINNLEYSKIVYKKVYKKNIGNVKRRLKMYTLIKNEYMLDMSADDILSPKFLEKTVEFLDKNSDYGAVSVNLWFFKNKISDAYYEAKYDKNLMDLPNLLARNGVLGSSLMRKKALDEADLSGGFTRYQDWDRWISMTEKGWKIGLVEESLFYYRQVPTSLSHSASIDDEMEIREKLLDKHKESYKKYYNEIILTIWQDYLKALDGNKWLEQQYKNYIELSDILKLKNENLKKDNKELKVYIRSLEEKLENLEGELKRTFKGVIKRLIRRKKY